MIRDHQIVVVIIIGDVLHSGSVEYSKTEEFLSNFEFDQQTISDIFLKFCLPVTKNSS